MKILIYAMFLSTYFSAPPPYSPPQYPGHWWVLLHTHTVGKQQELRNWLFQKEKAATLSHTHTDTLKHYSLTSSGLPVKKNRRHFKVFFFVCLFVCWQHCPTCLEYLHKLHCVLHPDAWLLPARFTEGVTHPQSEEVSHWDVDSCSGTQVSPKDRALPRHSIKGQMLLTSSLLLNLNKLHSRSSQSWIKILQIWLHDVLICIFDVLIDGSKAVWHDFTFAQKASWILWHS